MIINMTYLIYFLVMVLAMNFYFRIADRFNIIDKPNLRSSHSKITLRGGGIIFYFGALLWFIQSGFAYPWFFLALTGISLISFVDDIKPVSRRLRLGIHLVSMLLLFNQLGLFSGPYLYILIALIVATGILNAYNFMDGINGITGVYSLAVLSCLWIINNNLVNFIQNDFLYFVGLALLVFNFYNSRRKAKCFAGDVGSVSIAFILLFLLGKLIIQTEDFSYLILLAVYGVDSVITIIHRLILKENIFDAHRKHLYQILANECSIPHTIVSGSYALLQFILFAGFMIFSDQGIMVRSVYFWSQVLFLSLVYIYLKNRYYHLHVKNLKINTNKKS